MQRDVVADIDPAALAEAVGPETYQRGVQYARQHMVVRALWKLSAGALAGTVRGQYGNVYTTTARFSGTDGAGLWFERGECSCPVRVNCKHVVALVLTATAADRQASDAGQASQAGHPAWERSLTSLLNPRTGGRAGTGGPPGAGKNVPMAMEVTLSAARYPAATRLGGADPAPQLVARLVTRGKNGWVNGGLSWSGLGTLHYAGAYSAAHIQWLREFYALYLAGRSLPRYSYGDEKAITLSAFESPRLWTLLDEAAVIGLPLVHAGKRLGALEPYRQAELCLDATGSADALTISPVILVDGEPAGATPVTFIGSGGHGLVYVDGAAGPGRGDPPETPGARGRGQAPRGRGRREAPGRPEGRDRPDGGDGPLRIARLASPVPPALQRLALEGRSLQVPAEGHTRFREEYYPQLRQMARVISADGSFTPPAIPDPTLVLCAAYGPGHDLDLRWEWEYAIGDSRRRAPLQPDGDPGYRDPDAERGILAGLDAGLDAGLERHGLRGTDAARALVPHAALRGIGTMRFSTEVLPLLDGHPGIAVEISGEPADYREAGDSLRIGVSAGEQPGDTDWFDLGVFITVEGREVPFTDVFVALSRNQSHLLLADGAYFSLEKPELRTLQRLIDEARALQETQDGPLRISRFQAGLWDEFAALGVAAAQAEAWQRQVGGLLALSSIEPVPPPAALSARLRPYQADGFSWLAFLWEHRLGGILADDMGLGKTLQCLALICHARQGRPGLAPFLIVAPTSVLANWVTEAARFAPGLTVAGISDTLRKRGQDLSEIIAGADVVVTSYTLFRLDFDAYAAADWSGLLLDEAQFVKNHQSKAYQCARKLPAPFKLAITGTPMENNLMELWSLLSITAPGLFPHPGRFRDFYARPIENGDRPELLGQLRRRIRPLVKRRTKEQVAADLPVKQEQVLEVDLHPRHRVVYQRHLQRERQKILGLIDDLSHNRFTILRSLTLLRQLSLHAGLIDDAHADVPSSKLDALAEHLRDVTGSGHRALVFSQFTGYLGRVRARLDADGIEHCYLDGKTTDRAAVISRFKDGGAPVFLISLKAGGFGLNLTEADYCFLLDPWWNPATEAQAVDRTHRIGQTRNVMVYRLIARDTIEEKVMALKERKAELFASVMDDGNAFGATLDADDIRGLFS
ncbi:MAG: SNF2-related protein [Streptosporangiaceae bacterium]